MNLSDVGKNFKITQRPLDIIYVIDTSGSMDGVKIQSVNNAMHELECLLQNEAKKNPTADVNIRIITFGDDVARWHLRQRTPVDQFRYDDINDVDGSTPLGAALNILCDVFSNDNMPHRGLKPIVVLMSDGMPNDTWEPNLNRFLSLPWGKKAVKVAIAIGRDADKDVLERFTTDSRLALNANNTSDLKNFIKWTSTLVTHASQHATQTDRSGKQIPVDIPVPKTMLTDDSDEII